ncbi:hypothetical protein BGZ74_002011 [Mortierella antarctica]|nr:hypothetical protein BGZ74_002011 [Mortierella antarctica]
MDSGVALVPILSVGIDMASIAVLSISVLGLIGVIRGCRRLMNLYFGLVLAFIGVQVGYAVAGFISGTSWIEASLERSWGDAYHKDPSMIYDLQTELGSVLLLSILFKYLAVLDSESSSVEPGSPSERSLSDDKLPFFVSEKQLGDQDARIPLLFPESEEPECSNEAHFAESDIRRQGYQPLPGKVDESVVVVVA